MIMVQWSLEEPDDALIDRYDATHGFPVGVKNQQK